MADSMAVPEEILRQLGGNRFVAMTGASSFAGSKDALSFKLRTGAAGIRGVRIVLDPSDTYNVAFYKWTMKGGVKHFGIVKQVDGVYADQLREVFTRATGLETSLGTMRNPGRPSVYRALLDAGVPLDSHESDLYAKVTPVSTNIIKQYRQAGALLTSPTTFISSTDRTSWYDLPFQYDPFWEKVSKRSRGSQANPSAVRGRRVKMLTPQTYHFIVDLDERGTFAFHVNDENDREVFSARAEDEPLWLVEDGFMRHAHDLSGLATYLVQMGVIAGGSRIVMGDGGHRANPKYDASIDRNVAIKRIREGLKRRSGHPWSVTGGRGTAWGWIRVTTPPAHDKKHGRWQMSPGEVIALSRLLGYDDRNRGTVGRGGWSIPASNEYYRDAIKRAETGTSDEDPKPYWD